MLAWLSVLVIAAVLGLGIVVTTRETPPPAQQLARISLRLPIPAVDAAFAPYYLAVDRGFFARYGLDVNLEPGSPELNPVTMVAQGIDEFGVVGGPELLLSARAKGAPLVGVVLLHKASDFVVIITLEESPIRRLGDLNGKKVGFFYGHISTDVLRMLFKKEGVSVQEVDVGFDYGQLLSKNIDAQWGFRTTAGINLPARGVQIRMISPADYGVVTDGHMLITSERLINERPDLVQRFVSAVLEATLYSTTHRAEAVQATVKRDPNFQPTVAQEQIKIYDAAILRNSKVGCITQEDMERAKRQMLTVELIPSDLDVRSAYTTRFVDIYHRNQGGAR